MHAPRIAANTTVGTRSPRRSSADAAAKFRVPIDQHAASNQIGQHGASASAFAVAKSFAQTLTRDAL